MAERDDGFSLMVGERVRTARKEAGLTQEDLSERLGFGERQIVANIEGGKRKVSTEEMLAIMKILDKTLEFFTDPYLIPQPNLFSWRARESTLALEAYEREARNLVSANRRFADLLKETLSPVFPKLALTKRSSFEEASAAGEALSSEWDLGDPPTEKLAEVAERVLHILLLYVDPPDEISGGACFLPEFKTVLINRNEPDYRQNYDLGHELFHLLTWDAMPPDRVDLDTPSGKRKPRVEYLAENFAAGLLMPRTSIEKRWSKRRKTEIHDWLLGASAELGVSGRALYYRIKNLGLLEEIVYEDKLARHREEVDEDGKRPLYCEAFVKRLHDVLEKGLVSVRKAAQLLDCNIEDIEDLLREYGHDVPFEI